MKSRAAILHDVGGPWSVEDFELDPPRQGEVLVEMAARFDLSDKAVRDAYVQAAESISSAHDYRRAITSLLR